MQSVLFIDMRALASEYTPLGLERATGDRPQCRVAGIRGSPKEWLANNRWSLLRSVGLSKSASRLLLGVGVVAIALSLAFRTPREWAYLGVGLVGFLMLRYVLQRLQGVPEELTGPGEAVTEEWPFQVRLLADFTAVAFFLFAVGVLILGPQAIREVLP